MTLAKTALSHLDLLSLTKLRISSIGDIDELEPFRVRKQVVNRVYLDGIIQVTGEWSSVERDYYGGHPDSIWPTLQFDTLEGTEVTRYKIIYKYDDNTHDGEEFYSMYITPAAGSSTITIPEIYDSDPTYSTVENPPEKPSTKEQTYIFGTLTNLQTYRPYSGWKLVN